MVAREVGAANLSARQGLAFKFSGNAPTSNRIKANLSGCLVALLVVVASAHILHTAVLSKNNIAPHLPRFCLQQLLPPAVRVASWAEDGILPGHSPSLVLGSGDPASPPPSSLVHDSICQGRLQGPVRGINIPPGPSCSLVRDDALR